MGEAIFTWGSAVLSEKAKEMKTEDVIHREDLLLKLSIGTK